MISRKLSVLAQGVVSRPRVSADGRVVIWNQKVGENTELMKYENGETVNLSSSPSTHDLNGDLNRDGSVIAWRRASEDGSNLVVVKDGKEQVVDSFPADISRVSVSDDGSTIVYDENTQGTFAYNIRRYRDGKIEQVTDSQKMEAFPFVSGDGERIVYTKLDGKNKLMLKDGDQPPKEIVSRKESAIQPDISADGRLVVFSDKTEGDFDVHTRDLVTGEFKTVQGQKKVLEKQPQIASETGEIVYTGYDFRKGRPADVNIYLDSGTGTPPQQLSVAYGGSNYLPDVSENGHTVVWMWHNRDDLNDRRIYMLER